MTKDCRLDRLVAEGAGCEPLPVLSPVEGMGLWLCSVTQFRPEREQDAPPPPYPPQTKTKQNAQPKAGGLQAGPLTKIKTMASRWK